MITNFSFEKIRMKPLFSALLLVRLT